MKKRRYFLQLTLIIFAMLISCIYLFMLVTPSEETVRVRNALIHQMGQIEDFTWNPTSFPADFRVETAQPPPYIQQFVSNLDIDSDMSDLDKIVVAAKDILQRERYGGAIQSNTVDTLKTMQADGTGYCSDYTQVLNGLAYTMEIPVREWGMSFDGYSGDGHAFNEIFDGQLGKWVFVDFYNAFYVTDEHGIPLSVLEFRALLNSSPNEFTIRKILPRQFGFKNESVAIDYFQRGMPLLFLIWANDVFSYDANPLIAFAGNFSRAVEQGTGILLGVHQKLRLFPDPNSAAQQNNLLSLKYKVISIITLNLLLGLLFIFLLIKALNHRKISHG